MIATQDALFDRLVQHGFADRAAAERAADAVLRAIDEHPTDAAQLYENVRRYEHCSPGLAREHVDVVLRALADELDPHAVEQLARALPSDVARQLAPREIGEAPPHMPKGHPPPLRTLATSRAGSRHPICEAAPPKGHTHSVALNDDPHAETKLSSSRGMTQERWRESLATGRPPAPERPIDDATDDQTPR